MSDLATQVVATETQAVVAEVAAENAQASAQAAENAARALEAQVSDNAARTIQEYETRLNSVEQGNALCQTSLAEIQASLTEMRQTIASLSAQATVAQVAATEAVAVAAAVSTDQLIQGETLSQEPAESVVEESPAPKTPQKPKRRLI